eukprot:7267283-Prymnesium_polylepis.3
MHAEERSTRKSLEDVSFGGARSVRTARPRRLATQICAPSHPLARARSTPKRLLSFTTLDDRGGNVTGRLSFDDRHPCHSNPHRRPPHIGRHIFPRVVPC